MKPLSIALTGGIASGKSAASQILSSLDIPIIDADIIAKELVQQGQPAFNKIVQHLGKNYLLANGQLNRKKLGQLIFSNTQEKIWLETLLHPLIRQKMQQEALKNTHSPYVIQVIPLLVETQNTQHFDHILVITSHQKIQCQRLMQRDQLSLIQANNILNQQASNQEREQIATYIIKNNADFKSLTRKIIAFHQHILRNV